MDGLCGFAVARLEHRVPQNVESRIHNNYNLPDGHR
jgi:hypothetical protein